MNGKMEEYLRNIGDFVQIDDQIVSYHLTIYFAKVHFCHLCGPICKYVEHCLRTMDEV